MAEIQPLECKVPGVLTQDLQLVEQVEGSSEPDQQELEHLASRKVDAGTVFAGCDVMKYRQRL